MQSPIGILKQLALSGRRHKPYRLRADGWRDCSDFLRVPTELEFGAGTNSERNGGGVVSCLGLE